MLHTIIPTTESAYIKRLRAVDNNLILDSKKGNYLDFLDVTKFFIKNKVKTVQIIEEEPINTKSIKRTYPQLKIIAGGGITSIRKANNFLHAGADYIIIGRYLSHHPEELPQFVDFLGQKLIVSLEDSKDPPNNILKLAKKSLNSGVENIVYVAENKRLLNKGIFLKNFLKIRSVLKGKTLIYAGGVSSLSDIKKLKKAGADGIIIGTALYKHNFSLKEAFDNFN